MLTLKAKQGLEQDNVYQVGQSGLIGNPASEVAFRGGDLLLMIGTDFPYRDWYPEGKTVIQIDARAEHIGRRTRVELDLVGHSAPTLQALLDRVAAKKSDKHLKAARKVYTTWTKHQTNLTDSATTNR